MKYKNIFLDLDDTLWDTRANSKVGMHKTYQHYQLEEHYPDFEAFYTLYNKRNLELWGLYHYQKITKQELIRERFLHLLKPVGLDDAELAVRMNHDFLQYTASQTQLLPHALELLEYLHEKYKLYVITNGFREIQHQKITHSGLLHFFDRIIVSEDAGVNKPHPDIFKYALKTTNSRKKESIMLGDNPETDIFGAYQMKIDQIYFTNHQPVVLDFVPTYTVNSLDEVFGIL